MLIYAMVFVSLSVPAGRLIALYGAKAMLFAGFGIYALGSVFCVLAPSIEALISARAIQAVGGAVLFVSGPALVRTTLPEEERGRGYGIAALAPTIGIFAGPSLGSFVIAELGWRWIFLINIPICTLGILFAARVDLTEREFVDHTKFDALGSILLFACVASLIFSLNQGTEIGWTSSPILSLFVVSFLALLCFVYTELRTPNPALDLRLLSDTRFLMGALVTFLYAVLYGGFSFSLPIFLNQVKNLSIDAAGSVIAIQPLTVLTFALFADGVSKRLSVGMRGRIGAFFLVFALLLALQDQLSDGITLMVFVLLTFGVGQGLFKPAILQMTLESIDKDRAAQANGFLTTVRTLGQLIGIVTFETILSGTAGPNNFQVTPSTSDHSAFRDLFGVGLAIAIAAGATGMGLVRLTQKHIGRAPR